MEASQMCIYFAGSGQLHVREYRMTAELKSIFDEFFHAAPVC
jgi:hypothetical protein